MSLGLPPGSINLKCDPDAAVELRGQYPAITAGYHLSKRHWNTVMLDGSVPEDKLFDLIGHSYELVMAGLTRAERNKPRDEGSPPTSAAGDQRRAAGRRVQQPSVPR